MQETLLRLPSSIKRSVYSFALELDKRAENKTKHKTLPTHTKINKTVHHACALKALARKTRGRKAKRKKRLPTKTKASIRVIKRIPKFPDISVYLICLPLVSLTPWTTSGNFSGLRPENMPLICIGVSQGCCSLQEV